MYIPNQVIQSTIASACCIVFKISIHRYRMNMKASLVAIKVKISVPQGQHFFQLGYGLLQWKPMLSIHEPDLPNIPRTLKIAVDSEG